MGAGETIEVVETVENVWLYFSAFLGAIVLIGNALNVCFKWWKAWKAPNQKQDTRLDALEKENKEIKAQQDFQKKELDEIKKGFRMQLHATLAMCTHMKDGNHVKQLEEVRGEIEKFLVDNKYY